MKKTAAHLFAIIVLMTLISPVQASVSDSLERRAGNMERKSERIETKLNTLEGTGKAMSQKQAEKMKELCAKLSEKINNQVKEYETMHTKRVKMFNGLRTRTRGLVMKAKEAGKDTTKLEADLKVLNTAIEKLASDKAAYVAKFKATRGTQCGQTSGLYRKNSQEAATYLKQISLDLKAVAAAASTVETDIKELKLEVK